MKIKTNPHETKARGGFNHAGSVKIGVVICTNKKIRVKNRKTEKNHAKDFKIAWGISLSVK